MTLPVSGSISLSQVNTELGRSSTATVSLDESAVRTLFKVASGSISMSNGYGKANAFTFNPTIATNTTNYNLRNAAIAAGWDQVTPLNATVTINSGIYVYSTSSGSPAFSTGASFPSGSTLTLNNYGNIQGAAGAGGRGASTGGPGAAGGAGGLALMVQASITVGNYGVIGGGGGGGGGGGIYAARTPIAGGGGGGGQGANNAPGGAGGSANANGYAGTAGSATAPGSGGNGGYGNTIIKGGNGGALGSSGATGGAANSYAPGAGGAAGACTSGNASISWAATGTRYGALN